MRFLVYLITLLFVGVATAQNPTILQGNYITNVFGQANFVKNPNALINGGSATINPYVTPANATVTRSTTTPLVATTEFNVAITVANGTATWDLRAFDSGMKNQNCEARFTYRGFQSTSKVHIKQSTNTVASLNLTPTTDPRIASINFPCGDLSQATTFVVTDTSTLSNSPTPNEIGGIYVGLATNMANVAQAEEVGSYTSDGIINCAWATNSTTTTNFSANANCNTGVVTGAADTSAGKIPGVKFNNLKPGKYLFIASHSIVKFGGVMDSVGTLLTDGTTKSNSLLSYVASTADIYTGVTHTLMTEYTTMTSPTVQVQGFTSNAANTLQIPNGSSAYRFRITAYRFPLSSELVVKPETQNVFGGVKASSGGGVTAITSAAWTKITATGTLTRTNFGKAKVESNNDFSMTIEKLPVGNYYVSATGVFYAQSSASGSQTDCFFGMADTATGGAQIASMQVTSTGDATKIDQLIMSSTLGGVYSNTSVADRTFFLQAYRSGGGGNCLAFTDSNRPLTITVIPLDQPSNSALYVQGPVLGAQTGAAIPEGYVNEWSTRSIVDTANRNQSSAVINTWYYPWSGTLTLPAGNWQICYRVAAQIGYTLSTNDTPILYTRLSNQTDGDAVIFANYTLPTFGATSTNFGNSHFGCGNIAITSSKTFRVGISGATNSGTPANILLSIRGDLIKSELFATRLN